MVRRDVVVEIRPTEADPAAVDSAAAAWSDEFLECRTYGHNWRPSMATHNKRYGYWAITQRCPRCTSKRHMELTERFQVLAQWIEYADGYLLQGLGRITGEGRDMLRAAVITRTFNVEELSGRAATEDVPRSGKTRDAVNYSGEVIPHRRKSA